MLLLDITAVVVFLPVLYWCNHFASWFVVFVFYYKLFFLCLFSSADILQGDNKEQIPESTKEDQVSNYDIAFWFSSALSNQK